MIAPSYSSAIENRHKGSNSSQASRTFLTNTPQAEMTIVISGENTRMGTATPMTSTRGATRPEAIASRQTPGTTTTQPRSEAGGSVPLMLSAMTCRMNTLLMLNVNAYGSQVRVSGTISASRPA